MSEHTTLQALDSFPVSQPILLAHNLGGLRDMRAKLFGLFMLPFVTLNWLLLQLVDYWFVVDTDNLWLLIAAALFGLVALFFYVGFTLPAQLAQDEPMDIILTHDALTLIPHGLFGRRDKDKTTVALSRRDCVIVRQARPDAQIADILLSCTTMLKPLCLGSNKLSVALQRADNLARTLELSFLREQGSMV
jgi:hypothetical protein